MKEVLLYTRYLAIEGEFHKYHLNYIADLGIVACLDRNEWNYTC